MRLQTIVSAATMIGLGGPALAQCEVDKLGADAPSTNGQYGLSVSLGRDVAVVGAPRGAGQGFQTGSAHVIAFTGQGWQQVSMLSASDQTLDYFGYSVSISGSMALIGAYGEDGACADGSQFCNSGRAYVFQDDGTSWSEIAQLVPAGSGEADAFGYSVVLDGEVAVIGAPGDDELAIGGGAAYVFEREGGGFVETAKLLPATAGMLDQFGQVVAVHGDTIVVGARFDDELVLNGGAAYVFKDTGSGWMQTAKLQPSTPEVGAEFGGAVAVFQNTIVVGAPLDKTGGFQTGAAYVFEHDGSAWNEVARLADATNTAGPDFGHAVAVDGEALMVGSPRALVGGLPRGAVYVWRRTSTGWIPGKLVVAGDAAPGDEFGSSLSLAGGDLLVGARLDNDFGNNTGSVYLFETNFGDSLSSCQSELSLSLGGAQLLQLEGGSGLAGAPYLVLGTVSGTSPGFSASGTWIPLNPDGYLLATLSAPNTFIQNSLGAFDGAGAAQAKLVVPAGTDPALAGIVIHHAWVALDPASLDPVQASQAIGLRLEP